MRIYLTTHEVAATPDTTLIEDVAFPQRVHWFPDTYARVSSGLHYPPHRVAQRVVGAARDRQVGGGIAARPRFDAGVEGERALGLADLRQLRIIADMAKHAGVLHDDARGGGVDLGGQILHPGRVGGQRHGLLGEMRALQRMLELGDRLAAILTIAVQFEQRANFRKRDQVKRQVHGSE